MNKFNGFSFRAVVGGLLLTGAVFRADGSSTTYPWSETGSSFGDASGTVTIPDTTAVLDSDYEEFSNTGYDFFLASGADLEGAFTSGPLSGDTITGTAAPQIFNFPDSPLVLASATQPMGIYLTFLAGGNEYTIYYGGAPSTFSINENFGSFDSDTGGDLFTLNPVPEPGTMALAAIGGLALLRFRRGK